MDELPDSYVDSMPCDPELLADLGRVTWAAARLHGQVRDAINRHKGQASNAPYDLTLGGAVKELEKLAGAAGPQDQLDWAAAYGRPAVGRRNAVVHAVTYTASDGRQAIASLGGGTLERFQTQELRRVVRQLIRAGMTFPR